MLTEIVYSYQAQAFEQILVSVDPVLQMIGRIVEEFAVEDHIFIVEVDRQRIDFSFHQVLEEVCAEGWFGCGTNALAR